MVFCPTCQYLVIVRTSANVKTDPARPYGCIVAQGLVTTIPGSRVCGLLTAACLILPHQRLGGGHRNSLHPPFPMSATRRASVAAAKIDVLADHLSATERNNGRRSQTQRLLPEALREGSRRQSKETLESRFEATHQPGGCVHETRASGASERRSCG